MRRAGYLGFFCLTVSLFSRNVKTKDNSAMGIVVGVRDLGDYL